MDDFDPLWPLYLHCTAANGRFWAFGLFTSSSLDVTLLASVLWPESYIKRCFLDVLMDSLVSGEALKKASYIFLKVLMHNPILPTVNFFPRNLKWQSFRKRTIKMGSE